MPCGGVYVEHGGTGPDVLLLHGGVTDSRVWDLAVPALLPDYRVIRYDDPGYGRSSFPERPFSLLETARAVLDHLEVAAAHVVGLSAGGGTGIDLALAAPHRVASLTLVCAGLSGWEWPSIAEQEVRAEAYRRGDVDAIAASEKRQWAPMSEPGWDDLPSRMIDDLRPLALRADHEELEEPSAVGRLGEITAPTLVVTGDRDDPTIGDIADALFTGIRGARRVELGPADHALPLRVPDLVNAVILAHLASAVSRP